MRYIIASIFLCGCATQEPIAPVIINNKEKDLYIDKIEGIISEAASALTAVAPAIPDGIARELVEGQVARLSGVSKPKQERVESFRRMVESKDHKAVKKDKEEALKIDSETSDLWALVEEKENAIAIAQAIADNAEKERQVALKEKALWQFSTTGLGLFVAGLTVIAFTPWKTKGLILMGGGALAMGSLWIFDSQWFAWIVGTSLAVVATGLLFVFIKSIKNRYKKDSLKDEADAKENEE